MLAEPAKLGFVTGADRLGRIEDFFGAPLQTIDAPMTGLVFYVVTSLAINAGDPILGIGA